MNEQKTGESSDGWTLKAFQNALPLVWSPSFEVYYGIDPGTTSWNGLLWVLCIKGEIHIRECYKCTAQEIKKLRRPTVVGRNGYINNGIRGVQVARFRRHSKHGTLRQNLRGGEAYSVYEALVSNEGEEILLPSEAEELGFEVFLDKAGRTTAVKYADPNSRSSNRFKRFLSRIKSKIWYVRHVQMPFVLGREC